MNVFDRLSADFRDAFVYILAFFVNSRPLTIRSPFHSYTDAQREAAPNQQAGKTTIYTTQGPEIVSTVSFPFRSSYLRAPQHSAEQDLELV